MSHQSLNRFLGACRVAGPLELHAETIAPGKSQRRSFDRPFAVVGRDPRCDLPLEDEQVSQRHAYFQVIDGQVFALDLGSHTGTFWPDGTRHPGWLRPGEVLRIGSFQVRLEGDAEATVSGGDWDPLVPGSIVRAGAAPAVLDFVNGNRKDSYWPLERVLTLVGRSTLCPLQLVHRSVSKTHCALLNTAGGVWIVDLLGRGGLRVNGKALRWACLEDGDSFEVGEFTVIIRFPPKPGPPGEEKFVNLMHGDFYLPVVGEAGAHRAGGPHGQAASAGLPAARGSTAPATLFGRTVGAPGPTVGVPPGSPEALLMLFAQQFANMQQQMFDQFQQSLSTMLQTFSMMHHEQMGVVRGELDQLRQLTERLNHLQQELLRHPAQASAPSEPPAARPQPGTNGPMNNGRAHQAEPAAAPSPPVSPPQHGPEAPARPQPTVARPTAGAPPKPDVHVWLSEQIAALQRERQSVWQRLLSKLTGKGDEALP